ncbi:MAG: alpha/beta fold hydrolase [Pseudonocardiaceae bacterium]|nr:alpha/beta fold hydrolase [Pseudonocardiaceae bacterium]
MDYVLVHGTTQSTAGWQRLTESLRRRGHRVHSVDLPTDQPDLLAADYARVAAEQIGDSVREPVVVAHSGAGLLLPRIAQALRANRLVWLAAFVPDFTHGRSLLDEVREQGSAMFFDEWRSLTEPPTADPAVATYFLFHDCDLNTLRWALPTLRLFYPAAAYAESPHPGSVAPSTFVLPTGDRTLHPEWMRAAARDRLGIEPIEIDGGHCPHVSRPEVVADAIT